MKPLSLLLIPLLSLSMSVIAQTAPVPSQSDPSPSDQAFDAGPAPGTQAPMPRHGGGKQKFIAADTNGDGKLSRGEAQALPHIAKHFDAIDLNHDGYITRDEMRAAHERMQAARAQRSEGQPGGSAQSSSPLPGSGN